MKPAWSRAAQTAALVLATLIAVPPAFARTIRCESRDHRYQYCRADIDGRVTLDRELSDSGCRQGNSWGYDERGIWVDRGCRADFHIDEPRYGHHDWDDHHDRYDRDEDHHHKKNDGAAVAGAVAGAVILGALIAGATHDGAGNHDQAPAWMIGTFRGYNPRFDTDVDLTVSPNGTVDGRGNGTRFSGFYTESQQIVIGASTFDVRREGNGFGTTQVGDGSNRVHYDRVR